MADGVKGTPSSVVGRRGWLLSWDAEERDLEMRHGAIAAG